jgi:hypothetical protein
MESELEIDELWVEEVGDRIEAFERGELKMISAQEFFRPPSYGGILILAVTHYGRGQQNPSPGGNLPQKNLTKS